MTGAVHQFHPAIGPGDAVSNHVFALRERFRAWGYRSDVFAVEAKRDVAHEVLPYRRLFRELRPEDLLVMHFSIGSDAFDRLVRVPAQRALVYHNVTPPEFFEGVNPHAAFHVRKGRAQLRELAKHVPLAIGVSEFNRAELEQAGFERTAAVPILIDWRKYDAPPDERVLSQWAGTHPRLLFVGRIAPNKRQDQLVRLIAYYRRCVDARAQLFLVGGYRDQPQYHPRVTALAAELGVSDAIVLTGPVLDRELAAYYRIATAFVSLSEHEGFAMPLLEAFRFGVPVVAHDAGAVAETAGGAAIVTKEKDIPTVAELVALVHERPALRASMVAAGSARLERFATDRVANEMRAALGLATATIQA